MGKYCGPHPTPPPPGAPIPPPPTTHQQGHKAGAKEICALKYASFVVGWSLEEAMASSASSEHADPEALYLRCVRNQAVHEAAKYGYVEEEDGWSTPSHAHHVLFHSMNVQGQGKQARRGACFKAVLDEFFGGACADAKYKGRGVAAVFCDGCPRFTDPRLVAAFRDCVLDPFVEDSGGEENEEEKNEKNERVADNEEGPSSPPPKKHKPVKEEIKKEESTGPGSVKQEVDLKQHMKKEEGMKQEAAAMAPIKKEGRV